MLFKPRDSDAREGFARPEKEESFLEKEQTRCEDQDSD